MNRAIPHMRVSWVRPNTRRLSRRQEIIMLRHALRTAAVSVLVGGAAFLAVPASAQDATTTVAPVADTAAPVAEAPVADTAAPVAEAPVDAAAVPAETPAGGVAAGGGFMSDDSGSAVLPVALVLGAAGVGAGIFVSRRRKA